MVDEVAIKKDFEKLAEFTGSAAFAYSDIHSQYVTTGTSYDYPKVIREVSRLKGWTQEKAKEELIKARVLQYTPEGEFIVNVGSSTRGGGGINYSQGLVLFSYDASDSQTIYHEYAHSLQNIYDTFGDEAFAQLYDNVGLDVNKESEFEKRDYKRYLKEMHSDTFGFAALLLRSEDRVEFLKIAMQAMRRAAIMTVHGDSERYTDYGDSHANSKYYASYHVMKRTIYEMWRIKKQKKEHLYFDKNGVLDCEKFCKLAEDFVLRSAYSPKQFKAFKKHNFELSFTKRGGIPFDHNHKRDILKSKLIYDIVRVADKMKRKTFTFDPSPKLNHYDLINNHINKQLKVMKSSVDYSASAPSVAYQSIERIHYGISMLNQKLHLKYHTEDILRTIIAKRFKNQDFSEETRKKDIQSVCEFIGVRKPENIQMIEDFFVTTDEMLKNNKGNMYFIQLMQSSDRSLYQQKDMLETLKYNPKDFTSYILRKKLPTVDNSEKPIFSTQDPYKTELLINLGYNPNETEKDGFTVLMCCNNSAKAEVLIRNGADVNRQNKWGDTAVMLCNNPALMEVLLEAKPNLELKDCYGQTALIQSKNPHCVELLLKAGANINAQDNDGNTALMEAKSNEIIKQLLKANPDLEIKNKYGKTALTTFSTAENFSTILRAGADITTKDTNGSNPLMAVLISDIDDKEKMKIVETLIYNNIDANDTNKYGDNALVYAVKSKKISDDIRKKIIEKLIVYGIDTQAAIDRINDQDQVKLITDAKASIDQKSQKLESIKLRINKGLHKVDEKIISPIQEAIKEVSEKNKTRISRIGLRYKSKQSNNR